MTTKGPQGCIALGIGARQGTAFTVEKALRVGQKGDELLVMPFAEALWVAGKGADRRLPAAGAQALVQLGAGHPAAVGIAGRQQLQGPDQNLAELAHLRWLADGQGRIDARCSHSKPLGRKGVPRR